MKVTQILLTTTLVSTSVLAFGWANRASARTYVQCGPNAAAFLVNKVPVGCHVLPALNYVSVDTDGPSSEMVDTTPDAGATMEPGADTQGPNAAPDVSPGTPGSAFPDSPETTTPDPTSPESDTTFPAPDTTPDMTEPGADTQGPNAAPDTSPGTPDSAFPDQ